jgi:hypothetical protein
MMLRKATMDDLDGIYSLGERIHAQSQSRDYPLDVVRTKTFIASLIASKDSLVLVDDTARGITGTLLARCESMFFSKARYAVIYVAYAERRGAFVWLVRRFLKWAFVQKLAVECVMDASFGGDLGAKADKLYEKMGFAPLGRCFVVRRTA